MWSSNLLLLLYYYYYVDCNFGIRNPLIYAREDLCYVMVCYVKSNDDLMHRVTLGIYYFLPIFLSEFLALPLWISWIQ